MRSTHRRLLWSALGLFFYWALYSISIDRFPPFLDEAIVVHFGERITQTGPLAFAFEGRLFTSWYFIFFQAHLAGTIWIIRITVLLIGLISFACVIGIGRMAAGRYGALFAGLLYAFSTYHFFYARLALADTAAGMVGVIALYFAFRLSRRIAYRDALCAGMAVFLAVGLKINTFVYVGIPVAAVVALRPLASLRRERRQRGLWLLTALASALIPTAAYALLLVARGYKPLALFIAYDASTTSTHLVANNLVPNLKLMVSVLGAYWGIIGVLAALAALVILMGRRHLFLPLCFIAPLCVIWLSQRQTARYWFTASSILVIALAIVLAQIAARWKRAGYIIGVALVAWIGLQWLPFALPFYTDPWQVILPPPDYSEYVMSDASGYGLREVLDAASRSDSPRLLGLLANCYSLQYMALGELPVECPAISLDGANIDTLSQQATSELQSGSAVVVEKSVYVPQDIAGKQIFSIDRPGGRALLSLYVER